MLQLNPIKNGRKTNFIPTVVSCLYSRLLRFVAWVVISTDRKQLAVLPLAQAASFRIAPVGAFEGRETWFSNVAIWKKTQTRTDSWKDQRLFLSSVSIYRLVTPQVKIEQHAFCVRLPWPHDTFLYKANTFYNCMLYIIYHMNEKIYIVADKQCFI